jgi:sigma-E factor negative regulatory protein RseB
MNAARHPPGRPGTAAIALASLLALLGASAALAQSVTQSLAPAGGPATVQAGQPVRPGDWIRMIQNAARHQNFIGTIVYQHGDDVHSSHIVHTFHPATGEHERVLTLDGLPREFLRNGDEVQCFFPELQRVVVDHRSGPSFPELTEPVPGEISAHYEVRHVADQRVAGRRCAVLELAPRDRLRYGYRLWVDPATGLLLRAQTLGEQGLVMEQVSFTDIQIGGTVDPAQMRPSWTAGGWRIEEQPQQATDLERQGWTVKTPSGFRRLAEVMRRLVGASGRAHAPATDAAAGASVPAAASLPAPANGERNALQAVYTDGLATVSVFIEPGSPLTADATQRRGSVTAVSRHIGDVRVTVVGEVPPATAQSIAESVVYTRPSPRP